MRMGVSVVCHYVVTIHEKKSIKPRLLFSHTSHVFWGLSLLLRLIYYVQLVFSACVATVKYRPILHHCVDIFCGRLESWIVFVYIPIMRQGASVVWHLSLPLMKSFKKLRLLFYGTPKLS